VLAGLLALGPFYLLRRSLCFILPQPLVTRHLALSFRRSDLAALSVLFGAWTHTAWDSFTHDGGWAVERFAILRAPIIHAGITTLSVSDLLQQASTFGAGALLAFLYFRWLRQQCATPTAADTSVPDVWRYSLIAVLAVVALAFAIPSALRMASLFEGDSAFRVFVFRTGVYSVAAFVPLLIVSSIALYVVHRRPA
jgi:hypothetical protein